VSVPPPLFVLGIWRSGTTYLHTLLTRDHRFGSISLYEALNPHSFLGGGERGARLLDRVVSRRRAMDDMPQGANEPVEEDVAMAVSGMSSMLGLVFPRHRDRYWRWVTLRDLDAIERDHWCSTYRHLLAKLTLAKRKPLVLKSPANTARIRVLLTMFPNARFVHVHRHPYDVFSSTLHALNATSPWWCVQSGRFDSEWILRAYAEVLDAYFEEWDLIPDGSRHEIAYTDLVNDPIGEIGRTYERLRLPDFEEARPRLEGHLRSIRGYAANRYSPLSPATRRRLETVWGRAFEMWGYRPADG
jgi:hypothetical protein